MDTFAYQGDQLILQCKYNILISYTTERGENFDSRSIMADAAAGRDFFLCLGDFLDEFYRADSDTHRSMILPSLDFTTAHEHTSVYNRP